MSDEKALVPIEQKQVEFYGDELTAIVAEDGTVYIPVRPICEYLGVDWSAQTRRIRRDTILNEVKGVAVMATPGGKQEMLCLPLDYLNGWLFGINADRVKSEILTPVIRRFYNFTTWHW